MKDDHYCTTHLEKFDSREEVGGFDECNVSATQSIEKQIDIHERLSKRYNSGELSQRDAFLRHLDRMSDNRKSFMNHLAQMKMNF